MASVTDILTFAPQEEERLRTELGISDSVDIPAIAEQISITRGEILVFRREISGLVSPDKIYVKLQEFLSRQYAKGKMTAQAEVVTGTTDMKLNMASDSLPNAQWISMDVSFLRSIDWNKPFETQSQQLNTLSLALGTLATKLLATGHKPEEMNSLEQLVRLDISKIPNVNAQEKNAVDMVRSGLGQDTSTSMPYVRDKWTKMLDSQASVAPAFRQIRQATEKGDWTGIPEDNSIMGFAQNNKVVTGLAVAALAVGLYKFFWGGDDEKKETSKSGNESFMDSFSEYIPGGKASIGLLIGVMALVGIAKPELVRDMWNKVTGPDLTKKSTEELATFLRDKSHSSSDRAMYAQAYLDKKLPSPIVSAIKATLSVSWVDQDKALEDLADMLDVHALSASDSTPSSEQESSRANAETVTLARMYQGYHGFLVPYAELPPHQKRYYESKLGLHRGFVEYGHYEEARAHLPALEKKYTDLVNDQGANIQEAEQRIAREFEQSGGHPQLGDLEKNMNEMTPMQRKSVGLPENSVLSTAEHKSLFYRYKAIEEMNIELRGLEYHITAIKSGAQGYGEFMHANKLSPSEYYQQLRAFETHRVSQYNKLNMNAVELDGRDIQGFLDLQKQFEGLVKQQEFQVKKLLSEVADIQKREGYVFADTGKSLTDAEKAKNLAIDAKCRPQIELIAKIEWDVTVVGQRFMKDNERRIVEMSRHNETKESLAYKFRSFIPSTEWAVGSGVLATARNLASSVMARTPAQLRDLRFGPEMKLFRFWSVPWAMVITGIGAGYAWYAGNADQGLETAKRIGAGFAPLLGTELDFEDMVASFKEWKLMDGTINTAAFITSGCSDILLATGILSWAGVGLRGVIRPLIKQGVVESARMADGGRKIVLTGAGGKVLKEIPLSGEDIIKFARIRELIVAQREVITRCAKMWMVGGMFATLGLWGASIVSGYMDNGSLTVASQTSESPESKWWGHDLIEVS